jgi:hypothetical protein
MKAIQIFGPELSAILLLLSLGYFLLSFAPVLWPAFLAFRRKSRLPRPWLFVATVAALTYGTFTFIIFAFLLPAAVYNIFIAPQFEAAGLPYGNAIVHLTRHLVEYWWLIVPPAQLTLTWLVTRRLGQKWERICGALAA